MTLRGVFPWLVAAAGLVSAREASAFCRTTTCDPGTEKCRKNDEGCIRDGVPVKWQKLPIIYRFYGPGSAKLNDKKMRAAVRRAFDAWQEVECEGGKTSVEFEEGADIDEDKPLRRKQASEPFGIYFRDDSWPHDDADESLALTNQIYGEKSGNIDYADIEVNTTAATNFLLSDVGEGTDFQSVMTHEAGHYFGLAHSFDPESIMVARYCQSSTRCETASVDKKRALSDDDIAAVCAVYPPERRSSSSSTPPSTAGCAQSSHADLAGGLGLVFLASIIVRRRLRSSA